MKPPKSDSFSVLFCDDVRFEKDGRLSIMGLYGPVIEMPSFPSAVGSFCAVLLLRNPDPVPTTVSQRFFGPQGVIADLPKAPIQITNTKQPIAVHMVLKIIPLEFKSPGEYEVRFVLDEAAGIGVSQKILVRQATSAG